MLILPLSCPPRQNRQRHAAWAKAHEQLMNRLRDAGSLELL